MTTTLIDLKNITIGSDPEFFIIDKDKKAFPSFDLFEGTKEDPEDKGNGFAIVKDNVLIEMNIPPAPTREDFVRYMKEGKYMINSVLELRGLKLFSTDSMKYAPRYLRHPEACVFGCSAYKNAWEKGIFSAEDMSHLPIRVSGTHLHVGYSLSEDCKISKKDMNRAIARAFDYFMVYPSRLIHNDKFRSKYYGIYGCYRDTSYGLEVRALGGYFSQDKYLGWIYDGIIKSVEFCSNLENIDKLKKVNSLYNETAQATVDKYYEILGINLTELQFKDK